MANSTDSTIWMTLSTEGGITLIVAVAMTTISFVVATLEYMWKLHGLPEARKKRRQVKLSKEKEKLQTLVRVLVSKNYPAKAASEFLKSDQDEDTMRREHQALTKIALETELVRRDDRVYTKDSDEASDMACLITVLGDDKTAKFLQKTKLKPIYLDGYKKRRSYIAHAGPTAETVDSFWEFIWTYDCRYLLTLTPSADYAGDLCYAYWFVSSAGDILVERRETVSRADWVKRTLLVKRRGSDKVRLVKQYQIKSWGRDGKLDVTLLLNIRREISQDRSLESNSGNNDTMLVHEAYNTFDKVGAYIAIEESVERMADGKGVHIFNFVAYLRRKNPRLVETFESYRYIYSAVKTYTLCDKTPIKRKDLGGVIKFLGLKTKWSRESGFSLEFKLLNSLVTPLTSGECAAGFRNENLKKNRNPVLLPPDMCRPYIYRGSVPQSDYINAVYINSYYKEQQYIVTEWPMQNTIVDLWTLLFDCQVSTLVVLDHMDSQLDHWRYPQFWPGGFPESEVHGGLKVSFTEVRRCQNIMTRTFQIKRNVHLGEQKWANSGKYEKSATRELLRKMMGLQTKGMGRQSHTVRMIQLNSWPSKVKNKEELESVLMLNNYVEDWLRKLQKDTGIRHGPICIMSRDGARRCGVFCTLNIALNQLKEDNEVDIFSIVKLMKANRPELVIDEKEYTLCYELVKLAEQHSSHRNGRNATDSVERIPEISPVALSPAARLPGISPIALPILNGIEKVEISDDTTAESNV